METVPVEIDQLFHRGRMATVEEGWTIVDSPDAQSLDLFLTRKELSKDVALFRAQYDVDFPVSAALMFAQPEVYFSTHRPTDDIEIARGIEKLCAPGDAICWLQIELSPIQVRTASLIGTPQLGTHQAETYRLRWSVLRDFPHSSNVTIVVCPLRPDSQTLVEEWGVVKSTVVVLETAEDPEKTKVTEVKQLVRVPSWAVPMAAAMSFKHQFKRMMDYRESAAYQVAVETTGSYLVVGIRKTAKGPPLLPRNRCSIANWDVFVDWVEAGSGGVRFGFADYLRVFLERLGVEDVGIYDRLHGRQVMRYQAVVQQQAWERAWGILETPFRAQRAAYRRRHGGKNAPDISVGADPRFVPLDDTASLKLGDDSDSNISFNAPIVNTFVHFTEGEGTRPRLGSDPALSRLSAEPAYINIGHSISMQTGYAKDGSADET